MVFSGILRKSASALVPIASSFIRGGHRNYLAVLFTALNHRTNLTRSKPHVIPFVNYFSTATGTSKPGSSDSLLQIIQSEIKIALESDDHDRVEEIPKDFPFKIEDKAGQQTVILTREYDGELIKVEVHMPDLVTGDYKEASEVDEEGTARPSRSSLPLVVTLSKKSGTCLEFNCVAYPDEISIESLFVRYPESSEDQIPYAGPSFQDLDENLQRAFLKYLELRGITPRITNLFHEYMINKDSREYLGWLRNLKSFMEA